MGRNCAVVSCPNWYRHKPKALDVHYFRFPQNPRSLKEVWLRKCGRPEKADVKHLTVCSQHFLPEDYDPACRLRRQMMGQGKITLRKGAVPSQRLTSQQRPKSMAPSEQRAPRGSCAQEESDDSDNSDRQRRERRQESLQRREERQQRRHRKELVERLLFEHEQQQQQQQQRAGHWASRQSESGMACEEAGAAAAAAAPCGGSGTSSGTEPTAAAAPSGAADPHTDSADRGAAAPPLAPGRVATPRRPRSPRIALLPTYRRTARRMVKLVPLKTGSIATPPTGRQLALEDLVLERAKQIMRLKLRVRRLEVKCLRLMGVTKAGDRAAESAAPAAEIAPAAGSDKAVGARSGAPYEDTEDSPRPETAEAPTVGGRTLTDEPLLILRNDRGSKLPPILTLLKDNQLSERAANAVPSNLREAKEVNHQLKTQYLNLQASVLKWAMQNKVHNDRLIEAAEKRKALADSARDSRLRYLLRLEAAIKDMFTEAQIRHIIRRYEDSSGVSADKRTVIQWGEADVLRMLELRAISSDTVIRHVRDKMNIPLPTLKTVKLRCTKSPALSEAYVDMLQKSEANQKRCVMCERQVSTIDKVIGDGGPQPRADANRFGRSYQQGVPQPSHRLQGARPKKRRTTDTATVSGAKSRRRVRPAPGWLDSSDSSVSGGQLCGPGAALCGGRVAAARAGWNPEVVDTRAGLLDSSPDGLGGLQRRSWS